ncbi:MAG: hypothetical protein M1541_10915 [Acidobacteria bacterium]|nr:hypothetical protein [Acidobacteriota bacterium]
MRVLLSIALACAAFGQARVPQFEGASDVGNPAHKGSVTFDAATKEYRVTGGGNNIWGAKDDFFFVWRKISGPVIITANLKLVSDGAPHRKAGLMIRKDLTTGSPYADVMVHGSGLTGLQWREAANAVTRGVQIPLESPTTIRLERRGNWITLWGGNGDGPPREWVSTQVNLGDPVYIGLAVCAHDDKAQLTAAFSGLNIEAPPSTPAKKR